MTASAGNPVDALGLDFAARERELGAAFVREDRATIDEHDDDLIEASVGHFKRRVIVQLRRRDGRWQHDCDCPHFDETGRGCEHLWALRLLLEPEEEREDAIETEDEAALLPRWRLLVSTSLARGRLVLDLRDEEGRPLALDQEAWQRIEEPTALAALRELAPAAGGFRETRRGGGFVRPRGPFEIDEERASRILLAAAATERLEIGDEKEAAGRPVAPLPGETLELAIDCLASGDRARLEGRLLAGDRVLDLAAIAALVPGRNPWVVLGGRLHPVAARGAGAWARSLRREGALELPVARLFPFLHEVARTQPLPRLLREGRGLPVVTAAPQAILRLERLARITTGEFMIRYGDLEVAATAPGELALGPDLDRLFARDRRAEDALLERLRRAGFEPDAAEPARWAIEAPALAAGLRALAGSGIEISFRDRPARPCRVGAFRLDATSSRDWFRLEAEVASDPDDETPSLLAVLAGLRPDLPFSILADGRLLALDDGTRRELERIAPLAALAGADGDGLVLANEQLLLADLVLADLEGLDTSALAERRRALLERLELESLEPGAGFRAELRDYQKRGLAWLDFVARSGLGGLLADEMGLGKTVQIIAFLERRLAARTGAGALIVAPSSLLFNWAAELARFAPGLDVHVHTGPRRDAATVGRHAVTLTSYGTLRQDVELLAGRDFDVLVLDEAQAIKSRESQTAVAARRLRARARFALTGTPVENRLDELWSLFEFLAPELFRPGRSLDGVRRLQREAEPAAVARALRPVMLRRRKEEVLDDLPELVQQTILCAMGEEQERLYATLLAAVRRETESTARGEGRPALLLEALLRLRQAACHPALVGDRTGASSGKLDLLLDRLEEARAEGRKALVFSQFVTLLDLVAEALLARGLDCLRLDGRVRDRAAVCTRFQDEAEARPLLVSLKVGGTGLNLTAAEEVFILDPWWNPAVEAQAIGRAHRIGQERRVLALRLVSRGTVEEGILELQEKKRELADAVVGEAIDSIGALDADDLARLLA